MGLPLSPLAVRAMHRDAITRPARPTSGQEARQTRGPRGPYILKGIQVSSLSPWLVYLQSAMYEAQ